jgi:hypothetical protein
MIVVQTVGSIRTYRSGSVRPIAFAIFFFFSLPLLGRGFGGLALSNAQLSGHPGQAIVFLVLGGAIGGWCVFFAARMGVVEKSDGIVVNNRLSHVFIPWGKIRMIGQGRDLRSATLSEKVNGHDNTAFALLNDGQLVPLKGLSAIRKDGKSQERLQDAICSLEHSRRSHSGATSRTA